SVMPAAASDFQNRFPGRANGALTAAVHGLGLIPTAKTRTAPAFCASVEYGKTSSRPSLCCTAAAGSACVGRRLPSGDGLRQGCHEVSDPGLMCPRIVGIKNSGSPVYEGTGIIC